MAFKMQTEATDAFDVTKEPESVTKMYGETDMGAKLLVARRLVERGVRFVQVDAGGWDHHAASTAALRRRPATIDRPGRGAAQGSEAARPAQGHAGDLGRRVRPHRHRDSGGNATPGRNHNGQAFCCWMAGGGVKGGTSYGATDEFGARAETTACTSTTCTRRSWPCSALITRS